MKPMRDKRCELFSEKGQSLVLVALLFLAFAAILALVLDGGNNYAARRQAQNAADAGALAGASWMCEYDDATGGANTAIDYAVNRNGAANAVATANFSSGSVVVTATVTQDTFLAGLIGISQVSPRAVAEARCRPSAPIGVLPVGWSCRLRSGADLALPGDACAELYEPAIYILMDSVKVSNNKKGGKCNPDITDPLDPDYCYCDPKITDPLDPNYCSNEGDVACNVPVLGNCGYVDPTKMDCDLNNDCINELMAGGARSWLDLDGGGGGASELSNWIKNGFPNTINPHTWYPEESGVATSIFKDAATMVGKNVILPVYEKLCPRYPDIQVTDVAETNEACTYAPQDDLTLAGSSMNFHVIAFSKFHVTCVQTGKNRVWSEPSLGLKPNQSCPGHKLAATNLPTPSIDENDKTIEGYFLEGPIYGYAGTGDWFDVGTFVVVLVR